MYGDQEFRNYMNSAYTIRNDSIVYAEWNMNVPGNIREVGNYRNRTDWALQPEWMEDDAATIGALDADTTIFKQEEDTIMLFTEPKEKLKMLYSLEDCIKPNRPRSGINKPLYLSYTASDSLTAQYVNNYGNDIDKRPRYYMASREDSFKYWNSYRTENGEEFGISRADKTIEDVAPYVVYDEPVPCNRIVIKMQTNVGSVDQGPYRMGNDTIDDPLYGMDKATIPSVWKVQTLDETSTWVDAALLTNEDIQESGHVELMLGWRLHKDYNFKGEMTNFDALPISARQGDTYWCTEEEKFYTYDRPVWMEASLNENWDVFDGNTNLSTPVVTDLVNNVRKEYQKIYGIRIVVTEMLNPDNTFDLIEMSPRLVADITERINSFDISKSIGDLGTKTLPVGDIIVSTGSLGVNNNDGAFSQESQESILSPYLNNSCKFLFYDVVLTDSETHYIPLKTLYSEGFPQATGNFDSITIQLRDAFGILEREQAPELFLQDISLSFAITMLLDSIGFSNYKFYRLNSDEDFIIPFFFVSPEKTVADVLKELAMASQSSVWFNEENDFCVASKNWVLPSKSERVVDGQLVGNTGNFNFDTWKDRKLPNIISIASDEKRVANAGSINYTERYIQREKSSLDQSMYTGQWTSWMYKPVLLWEVSSDANLRDYNVATNNGSAFNLAALPIENTITAQIPYVVGQPNPKDNYITNNIIDFGEAVNWLGRANGYFYANGEIIKFDAMEYAISGKGTVWITSNDEYQDYFGSLPFNGKIYPTGRIRIYAEPYYTSVGNFADGPVKKHGRGQFGTPIVSHSAGIQDYWLDNDNCYGMLMDSGILFSADHIRSYDLSLEHPTAEQKTTNLINSIARGSGRGGIIKNFLADSYQVEQENLRFNTTRRGTVQASALVFEGPKDFSETTEEGNIIRYKSTDNIAYVYKDFSNVDTSDPLFRPFKHFGTRMRVVGEITSNTNSKQKAVGSQEYVSLQPEDPSQAVALLGGSGGMGIQVNPETNEGYWYEIVALSEDVEDRSSSNPLYPVTVSVDQKRVVLKTELEHNIEAGDRFLIVSDNTDETSKSIVGQWKAEGVSKNTITLRIEKAINGSVSSGVRVQKLDKQSTSMSNVFFYKIMKNTKGELIPYILWEGLAEILCDTGQFVDIQRFVGQTQTTVYDLGVEFKDVNDQRTFYLYLNGRQVGSVTDVDPVENPKNSMALFTRGSSKCMFNNVYALADRFSENTAAKVANKIDDVFGIDSITNTEAMRKYSMTGFIQSSYLESINTQTSPDYSMYFDEFGTIMREAAYFDIKYDKAYPALAAQIAPVINDTKTYVTSGLMAGAYGAEFLVFNTTDTGINLDAKTGAFLRMQGVTITQNTTKNLTVDDYYGQFGRLDRPQMIGNIRSGDPLKYKEQYDSVLQSRAKYGTKEFDTITSEYIQDDSVAETMLGWIINKTKKPRQLLGVNVFGLSHMQLGDIFTVDYTVEPTGQAEMNAISDSTKQFVVYQIDMAKGAEGISMTAYLVEA